MRSIFICLLLFSTLSSAHAVVSWGGQVTNVVAELPKAEAFPTPEGQYADLAVQAKQLRFLLFIPIWNYDKQYASCRRAGRA